MVRSGSIHHALVDRYGSGALRDRRPDAHSERRAEARRSSSREWYCRPFEWMKPARRRTAGARDAAATGRGVAAEGPLRALFHFSTAAPHEENGCQRDR